MINEKNIHKITEEIEMKMYATIIGAILIVSVIAWGVLLWI